MKILFLLLSISYLNILPAQGLLDGYMKNKGKADFALSYSYEKGKKFFTVDKQASIKRDIQSVNLYANYGITNKLNIVLSAPYVSSGGNEMGLQDLSTMLKAQLFEGKFKDINIRLMLGIGYQFPLSPYETESPYAIGQQAESKEIRGMIQFEKGQYFLLLKSGYSYKNAPNINTLPAVIKAGIAKQNFYADIFIEYQKSMGGGNYIPGIGGTTDFRELGIDFLRLGANYYRPISEHWGVSAGAAYTLDGRNIGKTLRISLGIISKI